MDGTFQAASVGISLTVVLLFAIFAVVLSRKKASAAVANTETFVTARRSQSQWGVTYVQLVSISCVD